MRSAYGIKIPQTLEEVCDPNRIALLVYDMQVGILSQIRNPERITQQVLKVLSAARDAGVRAFFSRHLSLPKELMGMVQFRMAMAWQHADSPEQVSPWFLRDAPGFQIAPELEPRLSEGVFDKLTMSAFEGTWLDFALARLWHQRIYHCRRRDRDRNRTDGAARSRPWLYSRACYRCMWHRR